MKRKNLLIAIYILVFGFSALSCGPGQIFGSTITPSPTVTNTPSLTATATLTSTATFTPFPTVTKTPFPVCKLEILSSADLRDFDLFVLDRTPAEGQKHKIVQDDGVSVSEVTFIRGEVNLAQFLRISKVGKYLISVDVKKGDIKNFHLSVVATNYDTSFKSWFKTIPDAGISNSEYTKVTGQFEVTQKPTQLPLILLRAEPKNKFAIAIVTTVWLKNLQVCLID